MREYPDSISHPGDGMIRYQQIMPQTEYPFRWSAGMRRQIMKETKNVWCVGKTAALLLLAILLACAVIVPASAEDSSTVLTQQEIQGRMTSGSIFSDVFEDILYKSLDDNAKADYMATVLRSLSGPSGSTPALMSSVPGLPSANVNRQAQTQYQMQTDKYFAAV